MNLAGHERFRHSLLPDAADASLFSFFNTLVRTVNKVEGSRSARLFFSFFGKREGIASTGCSFSYQLKYLWVTYHFKNTYSPMTLANISSINVVSIVKCSR